MRLFLVFPGVSLCSYNQQPSLQLTVHRDLKESNMKTCSTSKYFFLFLKLEWRLTLGGKKTADIFFYNFEWRKMKLISPHGKWNGCDAEFQFFPCYLFLTLNMGRMSLFYSSRWSVLLSYFLPSHPVYRSEVALPIWSSFCRHSVWLF